MSDEKFEIELMLKVKYSAGKKHYDEKVSCSRDAALLDLTNYNSDIFSVIEYAESVTVESICGTEVTDDERKLLE